MNIVLGIDVSKKTFDAALLGAGPQAARRKFNNKLSGFMELLKWVQEQRPAAVVLAMEATGSYGAALAEFAFHSGWTVHVLNPARVKAFATACGQKNKTDRADCLTIAQFAQKTPGLNPWAPLSPARAALRDWVRERLHLQARLAAEELRAQTASPRLQKSIQERIEFLRKQLKQAAKNIAKTIKSDAALQRQEELLRSIPGIGSWTAAVLLSELPPICARTKAREIASLFGLCPRIVESGSSVRGRACLSGRGRRVIAHQLHMPALVALKYNPLIKSWAAGLIAKGKTGKQVVAAAAHKLLRLAVGVLKTNTEFSDQRRTACA